VALPGAYAPANIALRVIGARKHPFHDKAVVLEGKSCAVMAEVDMFKKFDFLFSVDMSYLNGVL
jgi:hypothetical protein